MNNRGNIEILLVLCCVVGVVIFLCFGLSVISISSMETERKNSENMERLSSQEAELEGQKKLELEKRAVLEKKIEELEKEKRQKEKAVNKVTGSGMDLERKEKEIEKVLKTLRTQYESLTAEAADMQAELPQLSDNTEFEWTIAEIEAEKERLRRKLAELNRIIEQLEAKRADLGGIQEQKEIKEKERRRLIERWKDLDERIAKIRKDIERTRVEVLWKGNSEIKKPLFAECIEDCLILYPGNRSILLSVSGWEDRLREAVEARDGIVLLVRPSGLGSFREAYQVVITMDIKISFEPIDGDWEIGFLEEVLT